jgi:hypothetical protein
MYSNGDASSDAIDSGRLADHGLTGFQALPVRDAIGRRLARLAWEGRAGSDYPRSICRNTVCRMPPLR